MAAWCGLAIAVLLGAASGCAWLNPDRDQPVVEEKSDWTANLRKPGPKGQQAGLNPQAREIESHLGFR
jgi:hypothetical protein